MPRVFGYDYSAGGDILYGPFTILDNQAVPAIIVTAPLTQKFHQFQYSLERNGLTRTGIILIATDGVAITSISEDNARCADLGVVFSAAISGPDLLIKYTSSSAGYLGTFKYYKKSWS
jgi:hypothetical protein